MGDAGEFQRNQSRGVSAMSGGPQGVGMGGDDTSTDALAQFLHSHTTNETWILAVPSAQTGANLIIETGSRSCALGGFTGSDQVLNVTSLENYIHKDKVRYFETGAAGAVEWAAETARSFPGLPPTARQSPHRSGEAQRPARQT